MVRRRGTAIVETRKGIILTSETGRTFLLPGGGANKRESRFQAAIRELYEETGLIANYARIIFSHKSSNEHTVVQIKAKGTPRPRNEVKYLKFYNPGDDILVSQMSKGTKAIIKKYFEWKQNETQNQ